ncbi:proliferation marker protein Ki-67 isoform X2 [Hemibagrus wyckioides]|uniref:proliferation marker protein Ki-67 isoform X2 n=1 Tax=Hemibagrus wyckioides TaxID=337641 RepID=UPI00266DCC90|nr:proliferation marker protein Ki-67 isoform X2 [Hemibagrus wyckioides]
MPLLGKIVVIKRNGTDGTEFPLTASCLFGRKLDCDIRIQLPQVSKEHCRIEFNENKELILTNLSSVNPTRINGEILQQSERLKHGDLITIIDRSFRFEYPPAPTPKKKRLSTPGKGDTVKVLQDQQVKSTPVTTEKKKSEHATDTCLKDGSNLPVCLDQSVGDQQSKESMDSTLSPFSDLYNMVKRDLATKPVWKSASLSNTPLSRHPVDKQEIEEVSDENVKPVTPKSAQKKRRSSTAKPVEGVQTENLSAQVKIATPVVQGKQKRQSEGGSTPASQKKTPQTTPQKFTADQVAQQITFESPSTKSPKTRRSGASQTPEDQTTSQNPSQVEESEEAKEKPANRTSPRANAGKRFQVQDVLQEVVATPTSDDRGSRQASTRKHKCDDLPLPAAKRKRVSFGGQLSPELFDKRLPPNSPLRRGATPGRRSLGFTQKSQSLLRRASTIGLMGYQLEEDIAESPVKNASTKRAASPAKAPKTPSPAKAPKTPSPAKAPKTPSPAKAPKTPSPAKAPKTPSPAKAPKTPSPAKAPKTPSPAKAPKTPSPAKAPKTPSPAKALKTPSSAKKSPSPKAKTQSPKNSKTPPPSSKPSTPKSSRRLSNASVKSPSPIEESLLKTPMTHGRFSVSRISTPSPISDHEKETKEESVPVVEEPRECVTPRATLRRSSMKASARKTPKSVLKSALDVVRSRRSGASRANLKVVSSWADIVKFGQAKPQMEGGAKKTENNRTAVKKTKVTKPKTPAHRLKDHTSTGHADSPASIVVGKAYLRSTQLVGAAPKVVCNVALFKKDLKMDEDLTGVSDIFKTPANSRRKSAFTKTNVCPATPLAVGEMTEMSVMNTPEESGEMVVSPMSVASTAKLGHYNSEAVTRLLQDDQDGSLIEEMGDTVGLCPSEVSTVLDMPSEDQTKNKKAVPVRTPQHKPAPSECLTGVKRLMRTPKQKADPIDDLRGKLLKTPKEPKLLQKESLEGVKELLKTPKQKRAPLEEDLSGVKRLMETPKDANSPVVCVVALKRLAKTPKKKTEQEEDLTGVKRLMKTPKQKKQPVEEDLTGIQQMMKTPKQKKQLVEEDLTGIKQMMKTPKQKKQLVEEDLTGIQEMMKTPQQQSQLIEQKKQPIEEDLTSIQQMMKTPKQKKQLVEEDLTGIQEMMKNPQQQSQLIEQKKQPIEEDLTGIKQMMKTPKLKKQPTEEDLTCIKQLMKTPKQKKQLVDEDLTGIQEMMKTPKQESQLIKQKKQPIEEDLTGIKQMMKTPKQKKQLVDEDLTGIQEMMKTPKQESQLIKQKKQPIEEDLTGIKQMMKTPKQKKQPVEEDLTGIQQMMKTPKQKKQLVEDLIGVKSLHQTPKEKGKPVENDFGIDSLMTPKQKTDVAIEGSIIVEELETCGSGVLLVEDASLESKEKGNICLVEDVKNGTEAKTSSQEVEDEQTNTSSPAKKTRRGAQVRMAQKTQKIQEHPVNSDSLSARAAGAEEETSADSAKSVSAVRGRRGKSAIDLLENVLVQSPARKSTRGKNLKEQVEAPKSSHASAEDVQVALKPRRGRKAEQDVEVLQVGPVVDLKVSAELEVSMKSPAPARAKRGRKGKHGLENPQEPEPLPEVSVEEVGVASESAELQPSADTEAPVKTTARARRGRKEPTVAAEVEETSDVKSADAAVEVVESAAENEDSLKSTTKTRRGRATKKVMLKTSHVEESLEPTLIVVESDDVEPKLSDSTEVQSAETEDHVKTNSKPRRGRAAKKEIPVTEVEETPKPISDPEVLPEEHTEIPLKSRRGRKVNPVALNSQAVADESTVEPHPVESLPIPEAPAVRSGRGARNKQLKPQVEDAANGHATEIVTTAALTEEPAEPVVKNIRGGRRTKQPKAQVLDDSQEVHDKPSTDSEPNQQSEAPAARSARGKRTAAVKDESKAPVKRGRRAATVEVPPPVVKSSRGRKAASKSEPEEVTEDATVVVEPVEEASNETKVPASVSEEILHVQTDSEVVAKRGRGRVTKKSKVSTKDTSVHEAGEEAEVEGPQLKKDEPADKDDPSVAEIKQSGKGRKGRVAKKQDEPEMEKPAAEENVQPARRGRAAALVISQHDETAACPKRGQKRKGMEVVAEETEDTESLPKRKRGKGAGVETETIAAVPSKGRKTTAKEAEETSKVKAEEAPKKEGKPVRGRRKATQEDAPPQAEDPVPEAATRQGTRGQKKAEADVPAAPVRRTRRK